jgi:GNAT superfamily N-acetyltransferase
MYGASSLDRDWHATGVVAAGIAFVVGFALFFGSQLAVLNSFVYHGKEVGYWYALNWSVGLTVLFPLILLGSCLSLEAFYAVLESFASSRRLRYSFDERLLRWVRPFVLTILGLTAVLTCWEWYRFAIVPNYHVHERPLASLIVDWTIRASVDDQVSPLANTAFAAPNYVIQSVAYAIYWGYVAVALFMTLSLHQLREERTGPGALDWDALSRLTRRVATTGLAILAAILLTRLQNLYLRSGAYGSIFELMRSELWRELPHEPFALHPRGSDETADFSVSMGRVLGGFVALGTCGVLGMTFRLAGDAAPWRPGVGEPADVATVRRRAIILGCLALLGGFCLFCFRWGALFFLAAAIQFVFGIAQSWRARAAAGPQPAATGEPRVFLSYSHWNRRELEVVEEALREGGFDPWVDRTNLVPGTEPWTKSIERDLAACQCAVAIVGAQGVGPAQGAELEMIAALQAAGHNLPLVVVVPLGARQARDQNHVLLRHSMYVASQGLGEPATLAGMMAQLNAALGRPAAGPAQGVVIRPCETAADWQDFFDTPLVVQGARSLRTPLLDRTQWEMFGPTNPFFVHADLRGFVAIRGGRLVGRVAAIDDRDRRQAGSGGGVPGAHPTDEGVFGFFDCIDDVAVARPLLEAAKQWLRRRGLSRLVGPLSPSIHHEVGVLVDGLGIPPAAFMAHNPAYYDALLTAAGLDRLTDLWCYRWRVAAHDFPAPIREQAEVLGDGVRFRSLRPATYQADIEAIRQLYNAVWRDNWGMVPVSADEFTWLAGKMKPLLLPELAVLGEDAQGLAGCALVLPDVSGVLRKIGGGALTPWRGVKLLWYVLGPGRRSLRARARLCLTGVRPDLQRKGLGAALHYEVWKRARAFGVPEIELSWVLEGNHAANAICRALEAERYKTYRVYTASLREAE